MRFWLLDAIRSFEPGVQLTATKNVALTEEYLADHFPEFPVLPGVFMLEASTQAAAWLLRLTEDYAHSIIYLKEAKNIKYADFVPPGNTLRFWDEIVKRFGEAVGPSVQLYMIPGMNHCTGGPGTDRFNMMAALEQWVASGRAPDRIPASHVTNGVVDRTRPLCSYPQVARYIGSGSTDAAENFACASPEP